MEITKKQINFIEQICKVLDIENPNCKTKEDAQKWISEHINEYKKELPYCFYNWENEMSNG